MKLAKVFRSLVALLLVIGLMMSSSVVTVFAEEEETFTLTLHVSTIDGVDQLEPIVIENVPYGTEFQDALKMLNPSYTYETELFKLDGYSDAGHYRNMWPLTDYTDEDENKLIWRFILLTYFDDDKIYHDADVYYCLTKIVDKVNLTITPPVCGEETNTPIVDGEIQWKEMTNPPRYSYESEDYKLGWRGWKDIDAETYRPYIGKFVGGESYYAEVDIEIDHLGIWCEFDLTEEDITVNGGNIEFFVQDDEYYTYLIAEVPVEHVPAEPVRENEDGEKHDEAVYCTGCGAELSRKTVDDFHTVTIDGNSHGGILKEYKVEHGKTLYEAIGTPGELAGDSEWYDMWNLEVEDNGIWYVIEELYTDPECTEVFDTYGLDEFNWTDDTYTKYTYTTRPEARITEDVILYAEWKEVLPDIKLTVKSPLCGTETATERYEEYDFWKWCEQTNKPEISIADEDAPYYLDEDGPNKDSWSYWIDTLTHDLMETDPFIGTIKGGEEYFFNGAVQIYDDIYDEYAITDNTKVFINGEEIPPEQKMGWEGGMNFAGIVKAEHDWSEWELTKEATEKEEGVETRICSKCKKEETRPIEKLDPKEEQKDLENPTEEKPTGETEKEPEKEPEKEIEKEPSKASADKPTDKPADKAAETAPKSATKASPNTGDENRPLMWVGLLALSTLVLLAAKKKYDC